MKFPNYNKAVKLAEEVRKLYNTQVEEHLKVLKFEMTANPQRYTCETGGVEFWAWAGRIQLITVVLFGPPVSMSFRYVNLEDTQLNRKKLVERYG